VGNTLSHHTTISFTQRILLQWVSGVLLLAFLTFSVPEQGILNLSDLQVPWDCWQNFYLEVTVWRTQLWTALTGCYNSEMHRQVDFTYSFNKCNALPRRMCMCQYKSATHGPVECVCAVYNSAKHGQMVCAHVPLQQGNRQSIKIEMSSSLS